jgi:hypothetical protein
MMGISRCEKYRRQADSRVGKVAPVSEKSDTVARDEQPKKTPAKAGV